MEVPRIQILVHDSAPSAAKDDARFRRQVAGFLAFEPVGRRIELSDSGDRSNLAEFVEPEEEAGALIGSEGSEVGFTTSSAIVPEDFSSCGVEVSFESRQPGLRGAAGSESEHDSSKLWKNTSSLHTTLALSEKTPYPKLAVVQVERTDERPRFLEQIQRGNVNSTRVIETPIRAVSGPYSSPINSSSGSRVQKRAASTSPTSTIKRQKKDSGTFRPRSYAAPEISGQSSDIPTVFMTPLRSGEQLLYSDTPQASKGPPKSSSEVGLPNMDGAMTSPISNSRNRAKHNDCPFSAPRPKSTTTSSLPTKRTTDEQLSRSESEDLDVHSPSPSTGTGQIGPQNEAGFLPAIREKLPLEKHYRPKLVSRQLREHERGHWRIDTLTWDTKRKNRFWKMLREEIVRGICGWGVWATRRDDEKVESGKSCRSSVVKVYCWGEIVGDMWLVLYMTSEGKVKGTNAAWVDGGGLAVVEMD
jgi:hypothetical protein